MADNEEREQPTSRRNEWEVVSLSASAYAADSSPKGVDLGDNNQANAFEEDEAETSNTMFMSGHFVFPPSQHENLPLEPDANEIQEEDAYANVDSELILEEGDKSDESCVIEDAMDMRGMSASDEILGVELVNEKGDELSLHGVPQSPKSTKDEVYDVSELPCEGWWKRQAVSMYGHAKETNTLWSIVITAAVMGLVIIGQRWQQERWQKMSKMIGPIARLKDVIVGGQRRGSFIQSSPSGEH